MPVLSGNFGGKRTRPGHSFSVARIALTGYTDASEECSFSPEEVEALGTVRSYLEDAAAGYDTDLVRKSVPLKDRLTSPKIEERSRRPRYIFETEAYEIFKEAVERDGLPEYITRHVAVMKALEEGKRPRRERVETTNKLILGMLEGINYLDQQEMGSRKPQTYVQPDRLVA